MWVGQKVRIMVEVDGLLVHETTATDEDGACTVAVRPWIDLDSLKLHAIIGCTAHNVRTLHHQDPVA